MKATGIPSSSASSREAHAWSNVRPEIAVTRSIRFGATPNWDHLSRRFKIIILNAKPAESEVGQDVQCAAGVLPAGPDQYVQIAGVSGKSMIGDRERAYD
jgi:hypothetical protein